ncbi:MAG: hypothetical protein ACREOR_05290, partial [Candidatus Binatia bacterium]
MKNKTNSKFQTEGTGIGVLNFPSLGFIWLRFVSVCGAALVLRILDLPFPGLLRSAAPLSIFGFRVLLHRYLG